MEELDKQSQVAKYLLRVCTGKKPQKTATDIAHKLTDEQAATAIEYLSKYSVPDFKLLSKALEKFAHELDPIALRVVTAVVPVLNHFNVDSDTAVSNLVSSYFVIKDNKYKDEVNVTSLARGMMVGLLVLNAKVEQREHIQWVGDNAEALSKVSELLKIRRSISRSTCEIALSGATFHKPLQSGLL